MTKMAQENTLVLLAHIATNSSKWTERTNTDWRTLTSGLSRRRGSRKVEARNSVMHSFTSKSSFLFSLDTSIASVFIGFCLVPLFLQGEQPLVPVHVESWTWALWCDQKALEIIKRKRWPSICDWRPDCEVPVLNALRGSHSCSSTATFKKLTGVSDDLSLVAKIYDKSSVSLNISGVVSELTILQALKDGPHGDFMHLIVSVFTLSHRTCRCLWKRRWNLYSSSFVRALIVFCKLIASYPSMDLLEQVTKAEFFQLAEGRAILFSLVTALSYCHGKQIAHFDIRVYQSSFYVWFHIQPEKILCGADFERNKGDVFLSDFGRARLLENGEKVKDSSGAPSYLGTFFSIFSAEI